MAAIFCGGRALYFAINSAERGGFIAKSAVHGHILPSQGCVAPRDAARKGVLNALESRS